jgi:hypothetical protein
MPLHFTCPNGHSISCHEKLSGRPAKCPQCSVKFMVPPPGQEQADPLSKDSALRTAGGSGKNGGVATEKKKAAKEEQIVFLCPNGHKLNGPKRMQGKAGQCPECGARFRIPSYEDEEEPAPGEEEEILTGEVVGDDVVFNANELEEIETIERSPFDFITAGASSGSGIGNGAADTVDDAEMVTEFVPAIPELPAGAHALAGIFGLLWRQREHGGAVEMQLKEGELLTPDFYSPELSLATHGVFAVKGKDGTYTITSVPWDAVIRVSLRKTAELPESLFEE